jgi:RNA polymerase sigma-70 factor (ECF subfamily)
MDDSSLCSRQLQDWLSRMRAGDNTARDELLRHVSARLERLAHSMLGRFPGVARWEQTEDVLQNAVIRLLRALKEVNPTTVREFFGLAAAQMRRELLDLARHYQGPQGMGANHASLGPDSGGSDGLPDALRQAAAQEEDDLERWSAFHAEVDKLPPNEREVISLVFYHGYTQVEIARLLQVTERTVRRYWQAACLRLNTALGGRLPAT